MKIEVNTHERCMLDFANKHPETLVLSADLGTSCEVKKFRAEKPDQYLTMGIAEQNMCSWAAGLAREGYRPFLHTFSVFLSRRILDQVEMSVAYPNLPVTFVGFVPGITTPYLNLPQPFLRLFHRYRISFVHSHAFPVC